MNSTVNVTAGSLTLGGDITNWSPHQHILPERGRRASSTCRA
ncbi:MAG: hypothetical protein U1F77_13685 [Kiritimatiellia bacterium]